MTWKSVEGISETFASSEEDGTALRDEASTENTKVGLTEFLQNVLGLKDAQSIEYQQVHRMGKPREENGRERIINARLILYGSQTENGCSKSQKKYTRCESSKWRG